MTPRSILGGQMPYLRHPISTNLALTVPRGLNMTPFTIQGAMVLYLGSPKHKYLVSISRPW